MTIAILKVWVTILLLMLIGAQPLMSQTLLVVADVETKKGIPFVNIYTQRGNQVLGTTTDENGISRIDFLFDRLFFKHLSYPELSLTKNELSDTVYLQQKSHLLQEVVIITNSNPWIQDLLLSVAKSKKDNYGMEETCFQYDYGTRSLSDSSGYAFHSNGFLLNPGIFTNKKYEVVPAEGVIKYKDQTAGCDFSGLQKILYEDAFLQKFNSSFIKNYTFHLTLPSEHENMVTLSFEAKKQKDDRGYLTVDTVTKAIVEYQRVSGTEFNLKEQTSFLYRNFASRALGYEYQDLRSETFARYVNANGRYQLSEAVFKTSVVLTQRLKRGKIATTSRSAESRLTLSPVEKPTDKQWILLPKPFYIGIETKEDQQAYQALQNIPKRYLGFNIE